MCGYENLQNRPAVIPLPKSSISSCEAQLRSLFLAKHYYAHMFYGEQIKQQIHLNMDTILFKKN